MTVFAAVLSVWFYAKRFSLIGRQRAGVNRLLLMTLIQGCLGIGTLIYAVPVGLAVIHQGGAVLLFASSLAAVHSFS